MSTDPLVTTEKPPTSESAYALLKAGRYELAYSQYQQITSGDCDPDDWVNQAVCLINLDRADEASVACDRALALNARHPQALLFKGVSLHRMGRYQDAYGFYDSAVAAEQGLPLETQEAAGNGSTNSLGKMIKQFLDRNGLRSWVN